jgi:hypothetical protein
MQAMNNKWLGFASPKDHPLQNQFAEPNHHVLTFLHPIFYCKGHIVTMGRAGLVRTRNSLSGYLKPILCPKYFVQVILESYTWRCPYNVKTSRYSKLMKKIIKKIKENASK